MSALDKLLAQRRLVIASALLLTLLGVASYVTMPRQEDPAMPPSFGMVVAPLPGADAQKVERLVLEPLEEQLAEVDEIKKIDATARADVAILNIELKPGLADLDASWDEVEKALRKADPELPSDAGKPTLDRDLVDTESIVLAVTGSNDDVQLTQAAKRVKRALLTLPQVARVNLIADAEERVSIEYDDAVARRFGIDPRQLSAQLAARNSAIPGGSIKSGDRRATLRPASEFASLDEIAQTPLLLPGGSALPLSDIARVRRTSEAPRSARMRFEGRPAVGLGVVPQKAVNVLEFGDAVRAKLHELEPELGQLAVEEVVFQPQRVESRLSDLMRSLLLGVGVVAGVLVLAMGLRVGLVVASVVPLVAAASLGVYAVGGGVLQQISIAAMVLALGMLVDNAIVVVEEIQARIDRGEGRPEAALASVRSLFIPLAAATGTTLAAFIPMLLAQGPTAEFTRSIPIIVMLTLIVSYVFAVAVTPVISAALLRPRTAQREGVFGKLAGAIGRLGVRRRFAVLGGALLLVGLTLALAGKVERRFFPASDRNQLVVSLELPEGSHLDASDQRAQKLEARIARMPEVVSVASFVGRSTPKFYYNLLTRPSSPHLAQILITTRSADEVEPLAQRIRELCQRDFPELSVVARGLEQGPPVQAPIDVRLSGSDLPALKRAADLVLAEVRSVEGTRDVRHDLGAGVPSIEFAVDDAAAQRRGVTRSDVSLALLGRTRGLPVGQLRQGSELIPINIKSSAGELLPAEELGSVDVTAPGQAPVPLGQLARPKVSWQPAVIKHHQRQRTANVQAELARDVPFSRVLDQLKSQLDKLDLPAGVEVSFAGAQEGSQNANGAMLRTLPVGIFLLLFILLWEFNSFRKVLIVLATVPLAATGVIPGLLLSGEAFGFMSMLGVIALAGIVVNNAIVLLDLADRLRSEGMDSESALSEAVRQRTRPILLTTGTTVAGLLPLAFSSATLWPPLAWAMISGLIASTGLTLLVTPALYAVFFRAWADKSAAAQRAAA